MNRREIILILWEGKHINAKCTWSKVSLYEWICFHAVAFSGNAFTQWGHILQPRELNFHGLHDHPYISMFVCHPSCHIKHKTWKEYHSITIKWNHKATLSIHIHYPSFILTAQRKMILIRKVLGVRAHHLISHAYLTYNCEVMNKLSSAPFRASFIWLCHHVKVCFSSFHGIHLAMIKEIRWSKVSTFASSDKMS